MNGEAKQMPQMATIEIPVVIPPQLEELTRSLISLEDQLKTEIEFYRATREPIAYSERQLADYFGISQKSLAEIRRGGQISYTRVAGKIWYSRHQIQEYLEQAQTRSKASKK